VCRVEIGGFEEWRQHSVIARCWSSSPAMIPRRKGWKPFDSGRQPRRPGSEGGVILLDDEHVDGARITIERGGAGALLDHVRRLRLAGPYRFFGTEAEAQKECAEMKVVPYRSPRETWTSAGRTSGRRASTVPSFVERFP